MMLLHSLDVIDINDIRNTCGSKLLQKADLLMYLCYFFVCFFSALFHQMLPAPQN